MTSSGPMIFLTPSDPEPDMQISPEPDMEMPTELDMQVSPGSFKVLYVYTINNESHAGRLKVGDATYHTTQTLDEIIAESRALDPTKFDSHIVETRGITAAAKARIKQQVGTADIGYTLIWAILAIKPDAQSSSRYLSFRDYEVHDVLLRSGIEKKFTSDDKKRGEWFEVTFDQVKEAVAALQRGDDSMRSKESVEIVLRDEQIAAVEATLKVFKKGSYDAPKEFLWNAIMRFGKTLTSYALIKAMEPEVKRVLIITHRPVVSSGWYEDFQKSFSDDSAWSFASKKPGDKWDSVKNREKFIYFASIQDLRGSFGEEVFDADGGVTEQGLTKNQDLFNTDFCLTIVDESHEGNKTSRAEKMNAHITTKYRLHLSGTPFNIIEDFDADNIYTWSYIDEQKASDAWEAKKALWSSSGVKSGIKEYPGESNPYGNLPKIEIRTYDISGVFSKHPAVKSSETKFNFGKFFEVERGSLTTGAIYKEGFRQFVRPGAVDQLLTLMCKTDEHGVIDPVTGDSVIKHNHFPFSRDNSKRDFAHTFWIVPTIEAAKALHERLAVHPSFSDFAVVNATGNNDGGDALSAVRRAIKENDRTITLSVGKLTTGTTIPEWTGVFMLSNMSSPMLYMQTIFRVKSSGSMSDGRLKETGYVFDFAPDRSLNMVVQAARANLQTKIDDEDKKLDFYARKELEREAISEVLQYLPIIAYDGASFVKAKTNVLMETLQRVYISQTVNKGFDHKKLYNFDIHGITPDDLKLLEDTKRIVGVATKDPSVKKVVIAKSELADADKRSLEAGKPGKGASSEEDEAWKEASKRLDLDRKNAVKLVQILTGVSVRLPMLVFAANPENEVDVNNFTELIDDESWAEFMPKGFHKTGSGVSWESLKKFYNEDVFKGACAEIQNRTRLMDEYTVLERIAGIANLFSTFKNPDKETVLTPFSVVCRQYADTLGGLRFVDNDGLWYCKDMQGITDTYSYNDYLESREDGVNPLTLDPQWIPVEEDLEKFWSDAGTTILDINSKTALYPLMAAASLWWRTVNNPNRGRRAASGVEFEKALWSEIVEHQIFVNCRVPYSRAIANRVLAGYNKDMKVNASVIDVLDVRNVLKTAKFPELTQGIKSSDPKEREQLKNAAVDTAIADIWKWIFNPESIGTRTEDGTMTIAEERAKIIFGMSEDKMAPPAQVFEGNKTEDEL